MSNLGNRHARYPQAELANCAKENMSNRDKANLIEWMVIERSAKGGWGGRGAHKFRESPRKGDVITLNNEIGKGEAYEVIAVIHPLEPAETAGDLIIKLIGDQTEWRNSL